MSPQLADVVAGLAIPVDPAGVVAGAEVAIAGTALSTRLARPGQLGRVGPGFIFDGEHTFTTTALGPHRVLFTQREEFSGVAVPFYEGHLHADTLPQFRAMNAALAGQAIRAG